MHEAFGGVLSLLHQPMRLGHDTDLRLLRQAE